MMQLLLVANFALFCLVASVYTQQCDQSSDVARIDCFPEDGASQEKCQARGCCWRPALEPRKPKSLHDVNVPYCYYPSDYPSYEVMSTQDTNFGQRLWLYRSKSTYLPHDILNLTVDLIYETQQRFRFQIYDSFYQRYQVPMSVPKVDKKAAVTDYNVVVNPKPFSLVITRKSTGATL